MAWFRKERKRRASQRTKLEIPADAWDKCEKCGLVDISDKFDRALQVCPECGYHRRIPARRYVDLLTDPGSFVELYTMLRSEDALEFEGYPERLERARHKAGSHDAMIAGHATLTGVDISLGVMDFAFMGGSMGSVVGEKVARLVDRSVERTAPLILVSASGGARMQEGVLSLMQMAKTSALMARLRKSGAPYVSILTNPTTGGVSASYAMQGDINLAEPGAVIGFAGARVIKQTIGQDLPEGFQTAEFLEEHGMIDVVVPRAELATTVARLIRMALGVGPVGTST
jgi:acetyl-CoA carboxylase carboxyl transferase subunit beta